MKFLHASGQGESVPQAPVPSSHLSTPHRTGLRHPGWSKPGALWSPLEPLGAKPEGLVHHHQTREPTTNTPRSGQMPPFGPVRRPGHSRSDAEFAAKVTPRLKRIQEPQTLEEELQGRYEARNTLRGACGVSRSRASKAREVERPERSDPVGLYGMGEKGLFNLSFRSDFVPLPSDLAKCVFETRVCPGLCSDSEESTLRKKTS